MSLDVVLAPRDPSALAELATAVSTPGSGLRGDYLTIGQLRDEFSPTQSEVSSVESGLRTLGLKVTGVSADRLTVRVSGSSSAVERALGTSFERYRLASGRDAYTNSTPARLPAPIGQDVGTVVGLSNLYNFKSLSSRPKPDGAAPASSTASSPAAAGTASKLQAGSPQACSKAAELEGLGAYAANQLASAYGMTGLYDEGDYGQGSTVGVVEFEKDAPTDITAYESCYGITTTVDYIKVDGGATGSKYGEGEAALDIEDIAGLAPGATIDVYQAPNSDSGALDEFEYIVDHPSAAVVSSSWGECEPLLGPDEKASMAAAKAESTLFEYAAAEGQSWLSAAGDSGSNDCGDETYNKGLASSLQVDDPGSQPFVTSVGGTTLHVRGDTTTQTVWNNETGAGGGGISEIWPMPAYQSAADKSLGVVNANSSAAACGVSTGYCREVPDVTADANPETGFILYWAGSWSVIGGTSGAAPIWAAIVALTDASSACGKKAVGFLNPALYKVAGSQAYSSAFTDITEGNNASRLYGYGGDLYPARVGYDMASGLGAPLVTSATGGLTDSLCAAAGSERPGVDSLSADSGPEKGGNKITIYGYGFSDVTAVYFGAKKATIESVGQAGKASPTSIVVKVPAGTETHWVTVHNAVGPVTYTNPHTPGDRYTYNKK